LAFACICSKYIVLSSVKHSGNIADSGNEVNSSSRDDHGGFTSKAFGGGSVDLVRGDSVDLVDVLVDVEGTEGLEVSSNFFKTISRVLKSHHDVHL